MDITIGVIILVSGIVLGMIAYYVLVKMKITKSSNDAKKIVDDANSKAENIVKEANLDAKTQAYEYKLEAEKEIKAERLELDKFENKLLEREHNIDRRDIALQGKAVKDSD